MAVLPGLTYFRSSSLRLSWCLWAVWQLTCPCADCRSLLSSYYPLVASRFYSGFGSTCPEAFPSGCSSSRPQLDAAHCLVFLCVYSCLHPGLRCVCRCFFRYSTICPFSPSSLSFSFHWQMSSSPKAFGFACGLKTPAHPKTLTSCGLPSLAALLRQTNARKSCFRHC